MLFGIVVSWVYTVVENSFNSTSDFYILLLIILYCNLNFLNKLQYVKDKLVERNEFVKNKCQINQLVVQGNKISLEPPFTVCVKINFQLAQSQVQKIQSKNRFFFFKLSMWDNFIWVIDILLEYVILTNTNSFTQNFPSLGTENPRQSRPLAHPNVSVSYIQPYVRLYASIALKF